MISNDAIGTRIAKLRKEHQMTQEQFAEKLDISIKHCSAVERGLSCLSLEKLMDVSELFDVSLDYLIKENFPDNTCTDYLYTKLPPSIISIITSRDEDEIQLLQEYLRLYTKLRPQNTKNKEPQ